MLRIVSVSDKNGTAIDRLCHGVEKYHDNLEYIVCDVHPKRPDPEQLACFEAAAKDADIIDYQYFRTADMLREKFPWLKEKKSILTHNNPYSIHERDWNDYDMVVANNLTMQADLSTITSADLHYIPLTIDHTFWQFNNDWKPKNQVIMVANRIESKKGILEVAIAAADAGLKFVLVGAISDINYMNDILATDNVEFYEQVTDKKLKELYYDSLVHVCNSQDNFESGTLPILEAMMCGVPVITRKVGHVPDLYNGDNMIINDAAYDDIEAITKLLKGLDDKKLQELRENGWKTARNRNNERRAYSYQKLYRQLLSDKKPVSVIIPVYNNPDVYKKSLEAIENQTYENIEIVVCDDSPDGSNKPFIVEFANTTHKPVRYIHTGNESNDYGLARARNIGAIEATGEVLVFCDQRIKMDKNAVQVFVDNLQARMWVYGNKGVKKEFVENFSAINREYFIRMGMFCERMNKYGGLSQETRTRARYQGYTITFLPDAKAEAQGKSSNKHNRRDDIVDSKNKLWKMELE